MIKRSLKRQFTLIFVAIFAALLVLLFGLNKFFLQNYYLTEKVKMMDLAYMTIDRAVELAADNNETLFDLINEEYDKNIEDSPTVAIFRTLNESSNIDIAMMSSDRTMSAATSREANWLMNKLNVYMDVFDRSLSVPDVEAFAENEEENAESAAAQNDMPEDAVNEDGSAAVNETENSEMSESFDGENDSNDNSDAYPTQSSEIDTEATASDNESSVIDETITAETESASEDKPLDSKAESIMESIYSSIQSTKEKSSLFSFKEDDSHYKVLKQNDKYITQRIFDWRSGTTYIECFGVFSDGDTFFLMSMPLANIKEGVKLTLKFTFFSGLMILILDVYKRQV